MPNQENDNPNAIEETHEDEAKVEESAAQDDQPQQDDSAGGEQNTDPVEAAMAQLGIETEGEETPKADDKPAEPQEPEHEGEEQKPAEDAAPKPRTDDEVEAEVLRGVRSERGKKRLQKIFSERKEARTQIEGVQRLIRDSGLDADGFANMMSIARMVSSSDPAQQKAGLKALDSVRAELYKQAGVEAPGVDLLADQADLQKKVADMELSREDALAILRGRQVQAQQAEEARRRQEIAAKQQELQRYGSAAVQAFSARSSDPNFEGKVKAIQQYFAAPGKLETFVRTHTPDQWGNALLWMYDNIAPTPTQAAPARQTATPITQQRARSVGSRVPQNLRSGPEGIEALMESMGL